MWQRFTERARRVVWHAHQASLDGKVTHASSEHFLLGLCHDPESVGCLALVAVGVDLQALEEATRKVLPTGEASPEAPRNLSADGKQVIDCAYREALALNNDYVGTEHLLLSMLQVNAQSARVLCDCGVSLETVRAAINRLRDR